MQAKQIYNNLKGAVNRCKESDTTEWLNWTDWNNIKKLNWKRTGIFKLQKLIYVSKKKADNLIEKQAKNMNRQVDIQLHQ